MKRDTIAAISTGQVPSGIAVIRVSGSESINITNKIFKPMKPLDIREASSHRAIFGYIIDGNEKLDEVLITIMKNPHTYTGEDVVEISCHGSILVQRKILSLVISKGARPAGPGEFTMRAFLNGKMDLSQAESVMDIISSENDSSLKASMAGLSGNFSNIIKSIREKIVFEIAYIESALDDPEHMSLEGYPNKLKEVLFSIKEEIERLISISGMSRTIRDGIDCAIIGSVNVGKSSLLNGLTGEDRAIVTDIPGTTRDLIEQRINMGDFTLNIVDTAGLRESEDEVESIGIAKSREYFDRDCLILFVLDSSIPLNDESIELLKLINLKKSIVILNKIDLDIKTSKDDIEKLVDRPILEVSAKNLIGFSQIKDTIKNMYLEGDVFEDNNLIIVNERHEYLLKEALKSIELVNIAIDDGMTEEIFAVDLTDAYESLGKVLGLELGEDVINEIFSKFCIGK